MLGEILAAGQLIMGIGSAIANHGAQAKQKKANDIAAKDAFSDTSRQLSLRQEQEALSAAQQVHQISLAGSAADGTLQANAASAGVEGNTVDALSSDIMRSEYNARDIVDRNLAMTDLAIEQQRKAAQSEMRNRINGAQGPSTAATALQIGGSLAAFGYDWLKLQPPAPGSVSKP